MLINQIFSKLVQYWAVTLIVFSSIVILTVLVFSVRYITNHISDDEIFTVSGRSNVSFRVFYIENNVKFPYNPISDNLSNFLMSFTDFIEVDSHFSVRLSEEVEVIYTYTVTERLVVRHMGTSDGNLNPIVFEISNTISEREGSIIGYNIQYPPITIREDMGTYRLIPREHIRKYLSFVAYQQEQLNNEGILARDIRGFSAELFIDFEYSITIPERGITSPIVGTRGYRISLSSEVYSITTTGSPTFSDEVNLSPPTQQITLARALPFVGIISIGALGIFIGIKKLQEDPNEHRQEALMIFKKYANEIVESDSKLPLSQYTLIHVREFDMLLKLVVDLNKHIMCYHNEEYVEFATVVDEYVYYFKIDYIQETDENVIETATPITTEIS